MQLTQVKYLNGMADALQNRTKSTALRREILENQKKRFQNIIEHPSSLKLLLLLAQSA